MNTYVENDTRDIVVVANAEPYKHVETATGNIVPERVTGGLTTGLDPLMQERGRCWIAWGRGEADFYPGVVNDTDQVDVPPGNDDQYTLQRLDLSRGEVDGFYLGMSNQVLWPAFHGFTEKMNWEDGFWDVYRDVNQRYTEATVEATESGDTVLVQDYQLALVPGLIRDRGNGKSIGYFLHIPFPAPEDFQQIPHHEELFDSLSGSDLFGVHTERDVRNVLATAESLGYDVDADSSTYVDGHDIRTQVSAIPFGIDHSRYTEPETASFERTFRDAMDVDHLLFSLDRTDYTKGLPEKMDAYERFLDDYPEMQGNVKLLQNVTPSRTDIDAYSELITALEQRADDINGLYGTEDWEPVQLVDDYIPHDDVIGMYRAADVLLVTPVVDGMNLVAKEGVAANYTGNPDDPGMLVLGENAGAAEQLDEAVLVDPYDTKETADAIDTAIHMDNDERRERMAAMFDTVKEYDVDWWAEQYLTELEQTRTH